MSAYGVVTAQVLLTAQDVAVRSHYRTVRATFDALLSMGAVPIVNENDAVATAEFHLGDNDRLAALVPTGHRRDPARPHLADDVRLRRRRRGAQPHLPRLGSR